MPSGVPLSNEEVAVIQAMADAGFTGQTIANQVGCCRASVHHYAGCSLWDYRRGENSIGREVAGLIVDRVLHKKPRRRMRIRSVA